MASNSISRIDGSFDFSKGVNSLKATTIQSQANPNGLARSELAWLMNGTVRDGGITQRTTWFQLMQVFDSTGYFQGGFMYEPDLADPYLVVVISGRVLKMDLATLTVTDLSAIFNLYLSVTADRAYFCQGENYLIIQAGDYCANGPVIPGTTDAFGNTLPLFWDDVTLRRSLGINDNAVTPGTPGVNEIPAATAMCYYMGRIWYAQLRTFSAGDIVGGPAGVLSTKRDSILEVTENPLVIGGDGFRVPTNSGNIRALAYNATLDEALGQGRLFIFTRKAVYSLTVPVSRSDWINANAVNQPKQTVVQLTNGAVNDRSVVAVNGDLFFQSLEPSIRSLFSAIRYFNQWGNVPTSSNIYRLLQPNDRALLHHSSGIAFNNYLIQTALPVLRPQGVVHQALATLDFSPLSTLGDQLPPVWEGAWSGLDILQLFTGDFGGRERAFALCVSRTDQTIKLWEMSDAIKFEGNDKRVDWSIETPAYTWSNVGWEFELKKLTGCMVFADKILGEVIFTLFWREDGDPCWHEWHTWKRCTARNSCEDLVNPICYPLVDYRESYAPAMKMPQPPLGCQPVGGVPWNIAYQFQLRLDVKGWCRIRGILPVAEKVEDTAYGNLMC